MKGADERTRIGMTLERMDALQFGSSPESVTFINIRRWERDLIARILTERAATIDNSGL